MKGNGASYLLAFDLLSSYGRHYRFGATDCRTTAEWPGEPYWRPSVTMGERP